MSYFPDSLMPIIVKDESNDLKGNSFVMNAFDFNKHSDEIRAIESVLGVRSALFAGAGFSSAQCGTSPFGPSPLDPVTPCSGTISDVASAIKIISDKLKDIRDNLVKTTSGTIAIVDSTQSISNTISFPSDWTTTLSQEISDDTTDLNYDFGTTPSILVADTTNFPNEGYISLINDISGLVYNAQNALTVLIPGYTSMAVVNSPVYSLIGQAVNDTNYSIISRLPLERVFGLGTNVEIMQYSGKDSTHLLNVQRKAFGTTSTRHCSGDLVFSGRLSISVSGIMFRLTDAAAVSNPIGHVECNLRANGSINALCDYRSGGNQTVSGNTLFAYAQYQALLIKQLDFIPQFVPPVDGNCIS